MTHIISHLVHTCFTYLYLQRTLTGFSIYYMSMPRIDLTNLVMVDWIEAKSQSQNAKNAFFACFWAYVGQSLNHIDWATWMLLASINYVSYYAYIRLWTSCVHTYIRLITGSLHFFIIYENVAFRFTLNKVRGH